MNKLFGRLLPLLLVVVVGLSTITLKHHQVDALDNGLALTPPMGWLSWARFTCTVDCNEYPNECINSHLYMSMADQLVAQGYSALGYQYVNVDDCWSEHQRDAQQKLVGDKKRFPEGMGQLAKYMHNKQLKMGIYGDCGTATCDNYPAQLKSEKDLDDNFFEVDANTFASWQVDSFKFDGCYLDAAKAESICPKMSLALNETKRPMLVTCEWPFYMLRQVYNLQNVKLQPNFEIAARACNTWRYYEDVEDSWISILNIINFSLKIQSTIVKYHGPGHWFDPDQLVIGNFALSEDQARAQMAIWSVWSAPLYMSNDLRQMAPEMAAILKNRKLIEVNQDKMGIFGLMLVQSLDGQHQAFAKPVEPIRHGCPSFAIVFLNRNTLGNTKEISFPLRDILEGLPYALAAQRYNQAYPNGDDDPLARQRAGGEFDADFCKQLISRGMTKQPGSSVRPLLNKPLNSKQEEPSESIEEMRVLFNIHDLFGDHLTNITVSLDGRLTLRVNPSGVRAVKLIPQIMKA